MSSGDTLNSSLQQLNWLLAKNNTCKEDDEVRAKKEKPELSYSQLIREAIETSPGKKCTLSGIYTIIAERHPYYKNCPTTTWKNSVRHNLSLNKTFRKTDRASAGKGSYWMVADPSTTGCTSNSHQTPVIRDPASFPIPAAEEYASSSMDPPYPGMGVNHEYFHELPPNHSSYHQHLPTSNINIRDHHCEEEASLALSNGMSLFDSQDLSSSFRCVYDQVFHNRKPTDVHEEVTPFYVNAKELKDVEAQIDWLKIGLETAGIDYRDSEEVSNVRPEALIDREERKRNGETNLNELNYVKRTRVDNTQGGHMAEEEEEDEFDWNTIV